jgi:hypothetical protein
MISGRVSLYLSVAFFAAMAACNDFSVYDAFTEELVLSPLSVNLTIDGTALFEASGGKPAYTFRAMGVGTIDASTGLYTAPSEPGSGTVEVEDARGRVAKADISILAPDIPALSPAEGALNSDRTLVLSAAGGSPPYTFSILGSDSGTLGALDAVSCLYTPPDRTAEVVIKLKDSRGAEATSLISVIAPPDLSLSPVNLTLNIGSYRFFLGEGGVAPYVYSATGPGTIDGSGLYTAPADIGGGYENDTVMVTDARGATAISFVTIVKSTTLALSGSATLVEEGKTATFTAREGQPPYASFTLDALPGSGGSIQQTGPDTCLYTAGHNLGASVDVIKVTDALPSTASLYVDVLPSAPAALSADGSYGNRREILVSWQNVSANADGVCLERKTGTGEYAVLKSLASTATSYVDKGLVADTIYTYRAKAVKGSLSSPYSVESSDQPNR